MKLWNPEFLSISMYSPTFVPNLVTLAWNTSPGIDLQENLRTWELTVIFHVRSWKMRKKIRQNFFGDYEKTGTYID